jgi:phosphonate transport system permease protein
VLASLVALSLVGSGVFHFERYTDAPRTLWTLLREASPPDFARASHWSKPLLETLCMSLSGTAIAVLAALPLGALASGRIGPRWASMASRILLNTTRAIPCLVWGIAFVAAVGFGPLPGTLALACHSTGMLGKFFAEILEHAEPSTSQALESIGVGRLGVLRFGLLPQCLPRMLDVVLYRAEHNVREATTVGVVGAGGIGLEIVTAFHLFEYREALALILVLLALVTGIDQAGRLVRSRLLGG